MPRLIIDITELASWQGKLTGVPRVMSELSNRFFELKKDACFVVWDSETREYCSSDFLSELNKSAEFEGTAPSVRRDHHIIAVAKKLKNKSRMANYALAVPAYAVRKMRTPNTLTANKSILRLQKGDVLLVLADWHANDPVFLDYIVKVHAKGIKLIQAVYDLLPIVTPQYAGHATDYVTNYSRAVYPLCELIITISDNTKKDIAAWLRQNKLRAPKIQVIRLGDDYHFAKPTRPKDEVFAVSGLKGKDFLLCVGTIEARKNHTLLYYVYKLAAARKITLPKLIIVGRQGWQAENVYEMMKKDPIVKDELVILTNVGDSQLSWLYENCLFTVYPSFYEGWGLPIAESIARGVPCICSDTSSMPEIADKLIEYFNPASPDECLSAIQRLLTPKGLSTASKKLREYEPVSWDKSFEQVNKAIEEVYAKN